MNQDFAKASSDSDVNSLTDSGKSYTKSCTRGASRKLAELGSKA